tara:strand:+ start:67 stop:435 length:369 start_codon:yes stop_codon:yes gene_type:complete
MSIKSFKTQILIFYILFMFVNSIIPINTKGLWRYADIFHYVEFFILGLLFINAIIDAHLDINKFLIGVFILTLIPAIDESLQYFIDIPGRVADFHDFVIDIFGVYSGAVCFVVIHKLKNKNG